MDYCIYSTVKVGISLPKYGKCSKISNTSCEGAQWLSVRVLDSRPKGRGFKPHWRHCVVVLEQDTFILAKYWFNPGRPVPV